MQAVVNTVVGGVAKVTPSFVKSWYLNKLSSRLSKLGAWTGGGAVAGAVTCKRCRAVSCVRRGMCEPGGAGG